MSDFPQMASIVSPNQIGIARVDHYEVDKRESMLSGMRGGWGYCPEGKYARLIVGGSLMMSDTRMERMTNWKFVHEAHGNVLIAGLGLGMILHPVLAKPEVLSVTVIEKYKDVVALISPTVQHHKLTIICADIFDWKPSKGTKYDTIYFDIWPNICADNLDDIRKLHQRFKNYKTKDGWIHSWVQDHLKSLRRREGRW